jgi:hypothetical protein
MLKLVEKSGRNVEIYSATQTLKTMKNIQSLIENLCYSLTHLIDKPQRARAYVLSILV